MPFDTDIDNILRSPARIHLHFNDFYPWKQFNSCYVRGNAFLKESQLNSIEIADRFSHLKTPEEHIALSIQLEGFFSIVSQNDQMIYAAVDRIRSIPLFYCLKDEEFYISDNPHWISREIRSNEVDEIAAAEFMFTGYVTGRDTLYPDIKQLQAGEALVLEHITGIPKLKRIRYYKYIPGNYTTISEEDNLEELDRVLVRIFKRLIKLASGRTIVVPLSGGYDSRLIVLMLKRLGYDNVIAFSYGKPKNKESEISKKVAQSLGIRWQFVPYSNEEWYKWYRSEEFKKYSHMACGLSSVPHIQDWPAVRMLKRNELIPNDSIFVPGHGADILSGRVTKIVANCSIDPIEAIFKQNYSLWRCPSEKYENIFKSRIARTFNKEEQTQESVSLFEYWRVRERHAKFIINSLRAYEFWGYSWWIPFWDNEFMDFWSGIPIDMKLDQKIYKIFVDYLTKRISNGDIDLDEDENSWKVLFRKSAIKNFKNTQFIEFARKFYRYYRVLNDYENNPLAFYGAIDRNEFSKSYTGAENINSFIAADIIRHLCRHSAKSKDSLTLFEVLK